MRWREQRSDRWVREKGAYGASVGVSGFEGGSGILIRVGVVILIVKESSWCEMVAKRYAQCCGCCGCCSRGF